MQMPRFGALILITGGVLAGCSSTPVAPMSAPVAAAAPMPARTPAPAAPQRPVASSTVATVTLPPYLDPNNPISTQRSVYFDFDVYSIRPDETSLIERHGKFLQSQKALSIKIEGNADERGGAEYNLALGQKRADAVLRALEIYGVKDSQLEAVSWGKEHPKATGHDEAAWAENRRADLVYPKQ